MDACLLLYFCLRIFFCKRKNERRATGRRSKPENHHHHSQCNNQFLHSSFSIQVIILAEASFPTAVSNHLLLLPSMTNPESLSIHFHLFKQDPQKLRTTLHTKFTESLVDKLPLNLFLLGPSKTHIAVLCIVFF